MTAEGDEWLRVESLDLDARGVARRANGKVVFIEGALPGERVRVRVTRRKAQWEQAVAAELGEPGAQRVAPACPHFGLHVGACGGCRMQHLHPAAQVAVKQRVLEDQLWHLGRLRPERVLRPIEGPAWGYRQRARLSVRHVPKKGGVLVGFHERQSSHVADMSRCPVLPPAVEALLRPLRALVEAMPARERLPQIELAVGDHGGGVVALVLRHLQPLVATDLRLLRDFAREHRGVQWWLQPGGPDTAHRLDGGEGGCDTELAYTLPEFGLVMPYRPTDFTQVNAAVNRVLVARALRLLDAQPDERVIDWFCGLGNFTLALATRARRARRRGQRRAAAARARRRPTQRAGRAHRVRGLQPVRDRCGRARALRRGRALAGRPAARGGAGAGQGAGRTAGPAARGLAAAAAHRLCQLQPGDAGARRGAAGPSGRLALQRRRHRQHVPPHRASGEPGGLRARPEVTTGPCGPVVVGARRSRACALPYSWSPPPMPSSSSRLWNTLYKLRYRPSVAVM